MFFHNSTRRGFTLIELLLSVAIIAVIASIIIVAINPTKQLGDARNAQRKSEIETILSAVYQYSIDHGGLPGENGNAGTPLPTTLTEICRTLRNGVKADCSATGHPANTWDAWFLTGAYITSIPIEPVTAKSTTDLDGSGYQIMKTTANRIYVQAISSSVENGVTISAER